MIVATCVAVPATVIGAVLALMSAMFFDAPGSEHNPSLILLAGSLVAFPITCVVGIACAWIAFARHCYRGAIRFSLLPFLPVVTAIVGIVWLEVAYGGKFGT